jgi:phytoene desaturase
MKKHIAILGAGPGGLCAAMLLSSRGFKVSVYDKNTDVGGRNRALQDQGYTFDVGPTFLLMKGVLDDMFTACGRRSEDYLDFMPLNPMYQLQFDDKTVQVFSDPERMKAELAAKFPEAAADYDRFLQQEDTRFRRLYPCITRDYSSLRSFLSWDLIKALPFLEAGKSVFANLGRYFSEEKLRLVFSFQSKYLGMSPWQCPALFTMLSFLEHRYGIYHVKGGLNQIANAMAKVIEEQGGKIYTDAEVQSLILQDKTVQGIRLKDGSEILADEVVINADFAHAITHLVDDGVLKRYTRPKLLKKEFSCSTFMLYLGLDKQYDLPHHTIAFAGDYRGNVKNIFDHKVLSDDFSFYVQNASVTDSTLAPAGHSTLYVLVPVPNNQSGIDWQEQQASLVEKVLTTLENRMGLTDIRQHIQYQKVITPQNWEQDENVFLGATFNLSHKFSQMLYFRPHNRFEELDHCYLVGGGTHPGSGLPTIYESAYITAGLISEQYGQTHSAPDRHQWLNAVES